MHVTIKLIEIADSIGFILPEEALAAMKVGKGDTVHLTESPEGFRLTAHEPGSERQTSLADDIMNRRRDALGKLAK